MPIADSHAERRNLTVLSMAIIVYFLAGGELAADSLSLPLVNLVLHDTKTLVILTWLVLAWFTFRYWQEARVEGMDRIRKGLSGPTHRNHPAIRNLLKAQEQLGGAPSIGAMRSKPDGWEVQYSVKGKDGRSTNPGRKTATLKGYKTKVAVFRATLRLSLTDGCVWSYWMPFALAGLACALGLYHLATPEAIEQTGHQTALGLGIVAPFAQRST